MTPEGPIAADLIENLNLDTDGLRTLDNQIDAADKLATMLEEMGIADVTRSDVLDALASAGVYLADASDVEGRNPARNAYLLHVARNADDRDARQ